MGKKDYIGPVRFEIIEREPGEYLVRRQRTLLTRRPVSKHRAWLLVYILAEPEDLILYGTDKRKHVADDGRDFIEMEQVWQNELNYRAVLRLRPKDWKEILSMLGVRDSLR